MSTADRARHPVAESPPIWLLAGQLVIDRDPRPSLVVDAWGCIRATNQALVETRLRPPGELVGRQWVDAFSFDGEGTKAITEAMARAHREQVAHVTLGTPTPQGEVALTLFEVTALGPGQEAALVVSVLTTKVAARAEGGLRPASGLHYEVDVPTRRLRQVWSAEATDAPAGEPCHLALRGRSEPCPGCPLPKLGDGRASYAEGVLPASRPGARMEVVRARTTEKGVASVSGWPVDESLLSQLITAKIDGLSDQAQLTERERAVFDLLLLGRTHAEIASVLGITARTVKYHQGRVQAKLGADSRFDLLRVIL
jgi:DNA-binding CsgD family transcriptional regulator